MFLFKVLEILRWFGHLGILSNKTNQWLELPFAQWVHNVVILFLYTLEDDSMVHLQITHENDIKWQNNQTSMNIVNIVNLQGCNPYCWSGCHQLRRWIPPALLVEIWSWMPDCHFQQNLLANTRHFGSVRNVQNLWLDLKLGTTCILHCKL